MASRPSTPSGLTSRPATGLNGVFVTPGDKSISHRALILGALSEGETRISGLLEGEDVLATAGAVAALGAVVDHVGPGEWVVKGVGPGGMRSPAGDIDCGNAGTAVRLLAGVAAGQNVTATFTGDESLSRRPMQRIIEPLTLMGAEITAAEGGFLPMTIKGSAAPKPLTWASKVASAQVKSAILLAGLRAAGEIVVTEPRPSRDHTELMLRHFGVALDISDMPGGGRRIAMAGGQKLTGRPVVVPADPSSAGFAMVAALIVPGSRVDLPGIGLNPTRTGLIDCLREMGADITINNRRVEAGEPVGDLHVNSSRLTGITVPAERVPSMIDEFPILAMAAACAGGKTRMTGLAELRVKESDRLSAIARGLSACGVAVTEGTDSLAVTGGTVAGGATISADHDHRIAMSFLVLGMAAAAPIAVDDCRSIATSFPGFDGLMNALGARITAGAASAGAAA